ncbi:hypothetical protein RHSIM_Rhsim09G0068800 [Rhododendron simsii]|uniref:Replication factor A C-terminal domain-containing protein n=1 Tax=Rhododendron simsii TaxID=118357 RepID=A0A834LF24_RHOSS|nr:hypothetical protein RHSIM_Rhsim09G0068800 [Rhododendron simsii]
MDELVPVHVQKAQTSTNFMDQNFSGQSSTQANITTQTTCDASFLQTDQTDSLDQQFSNARDELCVLYDVPIGAMPPNILTLEQVGPLTRNYTVHVMITEKGLPRPASGPSSGYQRLLLQDTQGNKMQAIIYGDNIDILAKTLKLDNTYAITNALVTKFKDQFRFLPKTHQLVISAKSPVEEIKIDGFTVRSLQYNFTPLSDVNVAQGSDAQIDVLFAVLDVGPRRKPKNSYVVDLQVIDSRAIQKQPTDDDIITIVNLPTSVTEPEYPSIKGIIKVTDFNQNFYYLSCSECNRATNAYDDGNFWCNYCDLKVPPLLRISSADNLVEGGLFAYDIFWVFFTPVVVSVAKSFDAQIKLLLAAANSARPFSMLGLGVGI